jgi:hypothetical protein
LQRKAAKAPRRQEEKCLCVFAPLRLCVENPAASRGGSFEKTMKVAQKVAQIQSDD